MPKQNKMFHERKYTNVWGNKVVSFATPNLKVSIEFHQEVPHGYWWIKLKSSKKVGRDGALNLSDEECLSMASIFQEIEKRNKRDKTE